MLHRTLLVGCFLGCLLFSACSHASTQPHLLDTNDDSGIPSGSPMGGGGTPVSEGGVADGAVFDLDAGDAAQICNALSLVGAPSADRAAVADALPTATGGTIPDGTYQVSKYELYTGTGGLVGPAGGSLKALYVITGSKLESIVATEVNGVLGHATYAAGIATSSTTLTVAHTCPDKASITQGYSVLNGTTLVLINATSKEVITLLKQ